MNPVRQSLSSGGTAIGTAVFEFASPGIPRILAAAGVDFALYDMEHSGFGIDTIKQLMAAARATSVVPIVRVPSAEYHFIARALDAGARGIMVPMVESREQAELIVQSAKYPPVGRRGAAFGFAHDDYVVGNVAEKIDTLNERTLLLAQIETVAGVENVQGIASVEGIDVLWVGHFDLTLSMGIPAQFDHPRFLEAMERVIAVCQDHGKAAGMLVGDVDTAHQWMSRGFRAICYSSDSALLASALRSGVAACRRAVG